MNRNSEREAGQIVEKIIPEPEARRLSLAAFAEAIKEANRYGSNKWGVTLSSNKVRLNVGQVAVCTVWKGGLWLALEESAAQALQDLDGFALLDEEKYKIIPSTDGHYKPINNEHSAVWEKIKPYHFRLIELAANYSEQLRQTSQEVHSAGVLDYLRRSLEMDLPEPSYGEADRSDKAPVTIPETENRETARLQTKVKHTPNCAVFARNYPYYLADAVERGQEPTTFRSKFPWTAAKIALDTYGPRKIYFATVEGEGTIEYEAVLQTVKLNPTPDDPETQSLLNFSLPSTQDEGLGEENGQPTVGTLYVISNCQKVPIPFPISDLKKVSNNQPIAQNYGYNYAIVFERDSVPPGPGRTRKWDETSWRKELERKQGPEAVALFDKFYKWSLQQPYIQWDGSGDRVDDHATFWPWINYGNNRYYPPFCFRVDGQIEIPFKYINDPKRRPFNDEGKRKELQNYLSQVPRIELSPDAYKNSRPTFPLSILKSDKALTQLVNIFGWFAQEIIQDAQPKTYLLVWNPKLRHWDEIPDLIDKLKRGQKAVTRWSCGNRKDIQEGDRVFWIQLGTDRRGIFASGWVTHGSYEGSHWDEDRAAARDKALYVLAQIDAILNPRETILSRDQLDRPPFSGMHWSTQKSGIIIPKDIAIELEEVWANLINSGGFSAPEEILDVGDLYEGAMRRISVNAYERNPKARKACIDHYGASCSVCQLNFSEKYGKVGQGFIHVHHLKPLSEVTEEYLVDPIRDLCPVCPNCHAIIHKRNPPYTIEEVREFVRQGEEFTASNAVKKS